MVKFSSDILIASCFAVLLTYCHGLQFNRRTHCTTDTIKPRGPMKVKPLQYSLPDFVTQSIDYLSHVIPPTLQEMEEVVQNVANSAPEPIELAEPSSTLNFLGKDLLIFLCSTIGIVPLFKYLKASPVLGFLSAGLLMGPAGLGLFSDLSDMQAVADFGVLFLLFEQGLELTVSRLKSVSKYAFGMGTLQVLLCTIAFFIFPFVGGVNLLEFLTNARPEVVDITRLDEALVIGAALALSSSAFVLQILQEKQQLNTKVGEACLGILLLQDIAVVPLLVLLPIIESSTGDASMAAQLSLVGMTFLKALVGLSGILVLGGKFIRYLFSIVAKTKSSETFVALCLLVAVGVGGLTDSLGLSSTLGAFVAGTLLAESNYRTQIESDIKPFKGLLLGLFFLTTGASVDPAVIQQEWPTVLALLGGLIAFKSTIISLLGPFFNLSLKESVKTGLLLSGGGEFAFVVLTLGDRLGVLPPTLAKILVGVVVISMALTPSLGQAAEQLGVWLDRQDWVANLNFPGTALLADTADATGSSSRDSAQASAAVQGHGDSEGDSDAIVICGFSEVGQVVAKCIDEYNALILRTDDGTYQPDDPSSATLIPPLIPDLVPCADTASPAQPPRPLVYLAFDRDPGVVLGGVRGGYGQSQGQGEGNRRYGLVVYGDPSPSVLAAAGVSNPRAIVLTEGSGGGEGGEGGVKGLTRLKTYFPQTPVYACASTLAEYVSLKEAGAEGVVWAERESALMLSQRLLASCLQPSPSISPVSRVVQEVRGRLGEEEEVLLASLANPVSTGESNAKSSPNLPALPPVMRNLRKGLGKGWGRVRGWVKGVDRTDGQGDMPEEEQP